MSGTYFSLDSEFPSNHYAITTSDTVNLPTEMLVRAGTAGTVTLVDRNGVAIQYTATAGEVLPVLAKRVNATGTASTGLIGLY